jgi:hypothetical protein
MFALLIHGKEFITFEHFHIYLQPLVEELQQLWIKVPTYDVQKTLWLYVIYIERYAYSNHPQFP